MNITILSNRDLASNILLNQLLTNLQSHQICVFVSDKVGKNRHKPTLLEELAFFEQFLFNHVVFPNVDTKPQKLQSSPPQLLTFKALSKYLHSEIQTLNNVNEPEGLALLKSTQPDLILSIRFGKILKAEAIACAKQGVLNLHSGLLPEYKGVMATFWAMLNQEKYFGTTLHYIDNEKIDNGPIVKRSKHLIDYSKSYLENVIQLYTQGSVDLLEAVNHVANNQVLNHTTPSGQANYYSFPTQDDLNRFTAQNNRMINPEHIKSLIQAYQTDE